MNDFKNRRRNFLESLDTKSLKHFQKRGGPQSAVSKKRIQDLRNFVKTQHFSDNDENNKNNTDSER